MWLQEKRCPWVWPAATLHGAERPLGLCGFTDPVLVPPTETLDDGKLISLAVYT